MAFGWVPSTAMCASFTAARGQTAGASGFLMGQNYHPAAWVNSGWHLLLRERTRGHSNEYVPRIRRNSYHFLSLCLHLSDGCCSAHIVIHQHHQLTGLPSWAPCCRFVCLSVNVGVQCGLWSKGFLISVGIYALVLTQAGNRVG